MTPRIFRRPVASLMLLVAALAIQPLQAKAQSSYELDHDSKAALRQLLSESAGARKAAARATAVLIFPRIVKGGFLVAGQRGKGTLLSAGGRTLGYYQSTAASYGLQAGIQRFGYAMFFMNNQAMVYLHKIGGWSLGSAPSLVIVDKGMSGSLGTTNLTKGVYVFFFNQSGLMGGLGLQGAKITRID